MFKLKDLVFHVESAVLTGNYKDKGISEKMEHMQASFIWKIDIRMSEGSFMYTNKNAYEPARPHLYHDNGFTLGVRSWKAIEGQVKEWTFPQNKKGEEAGKLYVFEHEKVNNGKIEFIKRMGNIFYVRWNGTADVFWNESYGRDVPFLFEGEVVFEGINAFCNKIYNLKELQASMVKFADLNEFELISEKSYKYSSGKQSQDWFFKPAS
ncbi:hypothetical protein [Lacrimispora sp.]|uniref:hypothetical protein n=1 Tax=Lacrimispora sp. TaxID=2719234 RepID=UPI0028B11918|nr:hypothetical protein [Lacrimispora sp.]